MHYSNDEQKEDYLELKRYNELIKGELEFYKSIFKSHNNSAIFNLRIKKIKGKRIWVDKVLDRCNLELLKSLDTDDEVNEWLKPIKCER
tara:strand:- start:418 stop:684 length:267 start_codon:yes stop_codon:yes gene_type:complete